MTRHYTNASIKKVNKVSVDTEVTPTPETPVTPRLPVPTTTPSQMMPTSTSPLITPLLLGSDQPVTPQIPTPEKPYQENIWSRFPLMQVGKGAVGALEDVGKNILNTLQFKGDEYFKRNVPQTGYELVGRMLGSLGGILPAEESRHASELARESPLMQGVTASGMMLPGVRGVGFSAQTALRGGVGFGRTMPAIATPNSPAVQKLLQAIKEGSEKIGQAEELVTIERGKRASASIDALEKAVEETDRLFPTIDEWRISLGKLANELPVMHFDRLKEKLSGDDIIELSEIVWRESPAPKRIHGKMGNTIRLGEDKKDFWEYFNNMRALGKILDEDKVPSRGDLKRLENMFGSEMAASLLSKRKGQAWMLDAWNARKSLIASIDVSAPGRQGWKLALSPYWKQYWSAFGAQFKLLDPFLGRERFDILMESIRNNKHYEMGKLAGLFEGELGSGGRSILNAEEAFASRYIAKIPGFEIAERAYTGFLNKLRWESFYKTMDDWEKLGMSPGGSKTPTIDEVKNLARTIEWATGRGPIPGGENVATILNAAMFSPRFATAGPSFYAKGLMDITKIARGQSTVRDRQVSKIWAQIAGGHVVKNAGIIYGIHELMEAMGHDADIGWDPRESDFGKIRFGNIRYDFWGGDAQFAKAIARVIGDPRNRKDPFASVENLKSWLYGEKVSSQSGDVEGELIADILWKFLRTKMHPGGADVYEIAGTQEDFYGNEIRADMESIKEQAKQRLLFMFAQDLGDVIQQDRTSFTNLGWAVPSMLGIGVQAYETPLDVKNWISLREHNMLYEDLATEPNGLELQRAITLDPEVMGFYEERERKSKKAPVQERYWSAMSIFGRAVDELENNPIDHPKPGLKTKLQAFAEEGIDGKQLEQAIRTYLTGKQMAFGTILSPELDAYRKERMGTDSMAELQQLYRDKFWSVPLTRNLLTNIPDYEKWELDRMTVLEEAARSGLGEDQLNNITAKLRVSSDELVNQTIMDWYTDQEYLKKNLYSVTDDIIKKSGFWNYYQSYKASKYPSIYKTMSSDFTKVLEAVRYARQAKRIEDPEIERILWKYGDITSPINPATISAEDMERATTEVEQALQTIGTGQ